jgi:3-oxoacyl-[acyl-carrier protein] reductase
MITADLTSKTVLITGGGSGIGLAATILFARSGATVAANVLPGDDAAIARIERLAADGLAVFAASGDVAAPDAARRMVGDAIARLGRLDVLINNAGTINTREPIDFADLGAMTSDFWSKILSTNLVGPFVCAEAAASALKAARGAIVNTASVAGLGVRGSSIAYAASKAGLINLTRSLARALAPDVRVNAIAPGLVETPLTDAWSDTRKRATLARTLLARLAQPEDIAEAMLYLAAGAAYMTGQTIVLDGGTV